MSPTVHISIRLPRHLADQLPPPSLEGDRTHILISCIERSLSSVLRKWEKAQEAERLKDQNADTASTSKASTSSASAPI